MYFDSEKPQARPPVLEEMTEKQRHQLLVEWNDTHADYPSHLCVHELFEKQAERTPESVAVEFQGARLTYGALNRRANQLAHYLRRLGVGTERLVGLSMERSLDMVVGLLGILKAGGAYLPLDPMFPRQRLANMLGDARIPVLLTQERLTHCLPNHDEIVIRLDADIEAIREESTDNPCPVGSSEDLAYVIFTSGSTGRPKGVQVAHRALVNFLCTMKEEPGLRDCDVLLAVTTLSFDIAALELFLPLIVGARSVIADREVAADGVRLAALLADCGATVMQATPATWRLLLDSGWKGNRRLRILCGGEALSPKLAQALLERSESLWNMYGPTETTVWSTIKKIMSKEDVGIGYPIANTQIYILDAALQPVPVGEVGELCIGGEGLARDYLRRPDLTHQKFILNPFVPKERIYRTGDLARFRPDGEIEWLGRVDHQVKIRGFRIEVGEVESVLGAHPSIKQAVVAAREDDMFNKRLVAYVVASQDDAPIASDLRKYLQRELPDYMVPSAFVFLDKFPSTPNGKVDRDALPSPGCARPDLEQPFVAARTKLEKEIAAVWERILEVDRVGALDSFVELGGDSLKATRIITRLRELLQVELPMNCFFETPTVAELAGKIEDGGGIGQEQSLRIPVADRNVDLPLSFSQERVWFLQRLDPEQIAYNFQCALRFRGRLDPRVLQRSLSEIVRRHEIYRTTFPEVDGRPVQMIHPAERVEMPVVDLRDLPANQQEEEKKRLLDAEFQKRFDVSKLPLARWMLLRLGETRHELIHVEHHLVHDGWSFNVFLGELLELYKAYSTGQPSPLPDLTVQFADYACWQRQWMKGAEAHRQLAYWGQLKDSPPALDLPADRPRPHIQSFRGGAPRFEIPMELCRSLRRLSAKEGVSLYMTMFAVFATLLQKYSRHDEIPIGAGIANRRWRETESMIGMLLNNIVLRANLSGDPSFRDLLKRVRDLILEGSENQDVPFDMVVNEVQPHRSLSHNPLFQVMFGFHDAPMPQIELPEIDLELGLVLSNRSAKFDMTVIGIPHCEQRLGLRPGSEKDGLTLVWEYSSDLFDESTIKRMADHFIGLLEAFVANPDQPLSEPQLLAAPDREQMLNGWNQTATDYPRQATVHELFEHQAKQKPDSIAVIFGDETLSYTQLNVRANQLANYLRRFGVGPEIMVGICIERSLEMVVGLLGILKAGGAYLPLDPGYPQSRLDFMLKDASVPVVLTLSSQRARYRSYPGEVICLDSDLARIAQESPKNPVSGVSADNLAYLIYTSGSTGQPKGTLIEHRGVVRLVRDTDYYQVDSTDRIAHASTVSFDAATFEIWGALLNGALLIGVNKEILLNSKSLADFLQQQHISAMFLTTALFNQVAREAPDAFKGLKALMFGGESVDPDAVRVVMASNPPERLLHVYGPTESTTFASWYRITDVPVDAGTVPIGQPIANTTLYVLDENMNPLPVGIPGELYIGGDGLARGYLNQPELTAEKFVANPFSDRSGARLYRTGDQVRYRRDGAIEFLGRFDHQVKIRGFRIELGEIETVLVQHAAVRDAVVVVQQDETGDKRLLAYVVTEKGAALSGAELRELMHERLPDYMLPSAFMMLDELPLTATGKLDRLALPSTGDLHQVVETGYTAPRTELEKQLTQIWAEVLKLENPGIHDNFFAVGGHSLLAGQVMNRLRDDFGLEIPLRCLFEDPTVAGLAAYVEAARFSADGETAESASNDREWGQI